MIQTEDLFYPHWLAKIKLVTVLKISKKKNNKKQKMKMKEEQKKQKKKFAV